MKYKVTKYKATIAGGRGPGTWEKQIEVEAESLLDAAKDVQERLDSDGISDGHIVAIEQS